MSWSVRVLRGGGALFLCVCLLCPPTPPASAAGPRPQDTHVMLVQPRAPRGDSLPRPGPSGIFIVTLHAPLLLTVCQAPCQVPGRGPVHHPHGSHEETGSGRTHSLPTACTRRGRAFRGHRPTMLAAHAETTAWPGSFSSPVSGTEQVGRWVPEHEVQGGEWRSPRGSPLFAGFRSSPSPPAPPAPTQPPLSSADALTRLPEKIAC